MKTTIFKSVVLAVLVLTGAFTCNLSAKQKFVANEVVNDGLVTSKVVYKVDTYLHCHIKYDYTYNEARQMTSKSAFKWNNKKQDWVPCYKINYEYSDTQMIMEYARWNFKEQAFNTGKERSFYKLNENKQPISYENHKWDSKGRSWKTDKKINYRGADILLTENI